MTTNDTGRNMWNGWKKFDTQDKHYSTNEKKKLGKIQEKMNEHERMKTK